MRNRLYVPALLAACALIPAPATVAEEVPIGGRVLVPGGAPLPEAEVTLVPLTDALTAARTALDGEEPEPVARALTGADGRFQLRAPHAGLWSLRVAAEGFVTQQAELTPLLEPTELPDAEVEPDAGLTVRVVGADGAPISGARVQVVTDRSRMSFGRPTWSVPVRRDVTDAEGAVRIQRAESERINVAVAAEGHAWQERRGVYGTAATLRLSPGLSTVLEVRSSDDKPVADVAVALGNVPLAVVRTGEDGRATVALDAGKSAPLALLAADGRRLDSRIAARKATATEPERRTLRDRAAISGRLIDRRSRRPVSGGLVWDANNPLVSAVADNQGGFALVGPAGERLRLTAGAPGYLNAAQREFQLAEDGRPGPTLALEPAAAVEGRVVDGDGTPVAGADVELRERRAPGGMRIEIGAPRTPPRAITNARGQFRIASIDPEKGHSLHVEAEGFAPTDHNLDPLEPYRTATGVRVELSRGQAVAGIVVDGNGHGLADARITLKPASLGRGAGMMRIVNPSDLSTKYETDSDADGRFELGGLPAGKFDLEARRPGFAPGKVPALEIAGERVDVGEVRLEPGESLQGIALDGDGQPIEGVEVYVREGGPTMMVMMGSPGGGSSRVEPDAMTDPAGWFTVSDLSAKSTYDLSFNRSGFVAASHNGVTPPRTEPIEVRMDAASKVGGLIRNAEGDPVPGARVDMTRSKTIEMGGAVMKTMMMANETSDAEGRFLFEDQEPGDISLSAVASGYQEAKLQGLVVPKGEDLLDIEIPLPAGSVVEGRVLAPDGRPAIGATVNPVGESEGMMPRFGGTPTDGEGYFRLEGLAPGKASIEAAHNEYPRAVRDVDLREGINGVTLHFEGGQPVSGRVTDDQGNAIASAGVRLAAAGRFFGGPETISQADGTFELPGVQDGDYRLFAEAEGFASSSEGNSLSVAGEPVAGVEVRLTRGSTILGRITGLAPEEFGKVSVRAEGPSFGGFGGVRVDYEGNYRIENLEPGAYSVIASMAQSGRQARDQVVLEAGTPELRVDLEFGGGVTLTGRAVQGEEPVRGAMIYTSGLDIDHDGWNHTDEDGRFTIEGLAAGRYRVQLQHMQTGLSYTEEVDLGTSREIVLEVPTAIVSGRILDSADREPLSGVTVVLEPVEGEVQGFRPPHAGTTDLDGRFILDNVGDGNWRMKATRQGYAAVTRTVNVQFQKGPESLDVTMDPTEGLTLEARLPGGGIPGELRVAVLDASGAAIVSGSYATGENGRVRLSSVPPGSWELLVSGSGSATSTARAEAPGATVAVALEPACRLTVSVPELAQSNTLAQVRLTGADGRPFRSIGWSGSPRSEWQLTRGRLEFASLPPGTWTVSVTAGEGRSWRGTATTGPGSPTEVILEE